MQRWQGDAAILLCALASLFMLQIPSGNAAAADIIPYRVGAASRQSRPISAKARLERFSGFLREGSMQAPSSTLRLRGAGGMEVTHESNFELQSGNRFFSKVSKDNEGITVHLEVDGNLKDLTLHWGIAMNSQDEWITPLKGGIPEIVSSSSVLYKDRAIRTKFKKGNSGRFELDINIPAASKVPLGIRFVVFSPATDTWFPGGAGGNYYVPVAKEDKSNKRNPPQLQRSPSFTGAVDYEKMSQQSKSSKPEKGQVQLTDNLSHLMWNGAQREKAWVDGKLESQGMRISRSVSFDSAVKITENIKMQEMLAKQEIEDLWNNKKVRLYIIPFGYQSSSGRRKGSVRVQVKDEKHVEVKVVPEDGDSGPGDLIFHWGVGNNDVSEWVTPNDDTLAKMLGTAKEGSTAAQTPFVKSGKEQSLAFSFQGKAPKGLTFVLKDTGNGQWYKAGNDNFNVAVTEAARAQLAAKKQHHGGGGGGGGHGGIVRTLSGTDIHPPQGADIAEEIFGKESGGSVTLMHRYNAATSLIDRTPPGAIDAITMIFVWLRFSQIRQLSWQRNYNTKPRELSSASENLNKLIAWRWKNGNAEEKALFRLMLSCIGRGGSGGDGQAIRDEILHIMHRHKLPESKGHWMEEWHQKLHNNSTPDDIIICQAYLAFLASNGNMEEYLRVLRENGLSPEVLAKYERAITTPPQFYGDKKDGLINDFNNYLNILKNVHAGADLEKSVQVCHGFLDGHINVLLDSIVRERGASNNRVLAVIDAITEVRQLLGTKLIKEGSVERIRDMLYLDLGLEAQMRLMAERSISSLDELHPRDRARSLSLWAGLAAENLIYSSCPGKGTIVDQNDEMAGSNEIKACVRDWADLLEEGHKNLPNGWSDRAAPVVERMKRSLGDIVENMAHVQHKAEYLGYGLCGRTPEKIPEKWSITLFTEELIRGGGCSFVLSSILRKLDKAIRDLGGGPSWQIISMGAPGAVGELVEVHDLESIQSHTYERPTILLAGSISGEEEPPAGVKGIITRDAPDVLAHISVRARNLKILFATCFEEDEFESIGRFIGKRIMCTPAKGRIEIEEFSGKEEETAASAPSSGGSLLTAMTGLKLNLPPPAKFSTYCMDENSIDPDTKPRICGAKTANIVKVRRMLPDWIHTPASAVVPFGTFEKVLEMSENKDIASQYKNCVERELKDASDPDHVLSKLKGLILDLKAPKELVHTVLDSLQKSGIIKDHSDLQGKDWDDAWKALKSVWASKWNVRAFYSCKKSGIEQQYVQMAVLVQRLVEAEYAFVVHTVNPAGDDENEMYAEVVVGLGEVLVGNFPGRALGFSMRKDESSGPQIKSLPSKSVGLFGGGLIFRSDSNGEDLPGFAGAGLYDSVPMVHNVKKTITYHDEPLVHDLGLQDKIMRGICKLAVDVEKCYGGEPQDIEGCYKDGKFYVVQTRPQV